MSQREVYIGTLDFTMCGHKLSEGCYNCCYRCNYGWHFCPGCGVLLKHGVGVCDSCMSYVIDEAHDAARDQI